MPSISIQSIKGGEEGVLYQGARDQQPSPYPTSPSSSRQDTSPARDSVSPRRHQSRCRIACPIISLCIGVLALFITGGILLYFYHAQLFELSQWMKARAPLSALYYLLFTILWIVLCLPSTLVELCGGFIFGFQVAFWTMVVGKLAGCCLAFFLGRCFAADSLRDTLLRRTTSATINEEGKGKIKSKKTHRHRAQAFYLAMQHHPWKFTFLIRFSFLPMSMKNYGMACLPVPFYIFAICTFAAGLPFTIVWAHMGASSASLLNLMAKIHRGKKAPIQEIIGLVLVLTLAPVLVFVLRHYTYPPTYLSKQEIIGLVLGLTLALVLVLVIQHYTKKYTSHLAEEEEAEIEAAEEGEGEMEEEEKGLISRPEGGGEGGYQQVLGKEGKGLVGRLEEKEEGRRLMEGAGSSSSSKMGKEASSSVSPTLYTPLKEAGAVPTPPGYGSSSSSSSCASGRIIDTSNKKKKTKKGRGGGTKGSINSTVI